MNLLLLAAVAKLLGAITTKKRLCFGALFGAVGALIIFFPYINAGFQLIYKLLLSVGVVAVTFGIHPWQRFAKCLLLFFVTSFLFAGLMLMVNFLFAPKGMLFYNGIVYFDISALLLIVCTVAAYLLLSLLEWLFASRTQEKQLYDLMVTVSGAAISCKGLVDTGSNLREPFSGAPVIVCDYTLTQRLHPGMDHRMRVIPCLTIAGETALEGFRPDSVVISGQGGRIQTTDCYIASSKQPIRGDYQALIHPQLIVGKGSGSFDKMAD
ncbi:MAG: sigma-E processing peptidase SpoIIGA [Anaerotruncus sp.]|nr:sigma-E processing peptidase SpoIIGA [Anaerotruncus sp.]